MDTRKEQDQLTHPWQRDIFDAFQGKNIAHVGYVPDGGHQGLIGLCHADPDMGTTVFTSEEEGMGLVTGLWLGGQKSVLLMQSSGVGNCMNMLTLCENTRTPLVMLVTMRGEFAEFVPWQVRMGQSTPDLFKTMGVDVYRAEPGEDVGDLVSGCIDHAYFSSRMVAVLLSQRLVGRKNWSK